MKPTENILITGGNGFIGRHLIEYLQTKHYRVIHPDSQELDVRTEADFDSFCGTDISHVIHLAGRTFVPASWENPKNFFEVNVMGTLQVIEFCRRYGINLTYISAYIYGQPKSIPVSETSDVKPDNPYAKSKYMAEELCEFYSSFFSMNISVLRLFNVYGPGQNENFLIPAIMRQLCSDSAKIEVNDLNPRRDYIYIEDVCNAIELSIEKSKGFQLYNIGSGVSFSVQEIIDLLQKLAGTHKQTVSRNMVRRNELNDVTADISCIKENWKWEPSISLEEGLRRCLLAEK